MQETGRGRFQPISQLGSFGRPTAIVINSADMRTAFKIHSSVTNLNDPTTLVGLIEDPTFVSKVSDGNWNRLTLSRDLFGTPTPPWRANISSRSLKNSEILILKYESSQVKFEKVEAALRKSGHSTALVLLQLTTKHLGASLLSQQNNAISEDSRTIFSLEPRSSSGFQKYE